MYCTECGSAVKTETNFCEECRTPVERIKPGSAVSPTHSGQTPSKPLGLVLVAVYIGISAVLEVFSGVRFLMVSALPEQWWATIPGLEGLLRGVLNCAATYGLWALISWGYSLTRLICIVSIPLGLGALLINMQVGNVILQLVQAVLFVWILVYLAKPEIKGLFHAS